MVHLLLILSLIAAILVSVPLCVFLVECLAALKPPPRRAAEADPLARPSLGVIVPAHNEEAGLPATLAALLPQLARGDRVVVVADNCTDRTADIAREAGAECVERFDDVLRGKGYALAAGMDALRNDKPAVVVVIDADCRVEPRSLGRLAAAAAAANAPVQCVYLLEPDPGANPISRLSNFAFLVKNLVRQRGMMVLGQPALLQGTGMAFPWMVIDAASLATGHITEDLVIGLDMLERGHSPRFCDSARVFSAQASPEAEVAQRTRWEHGYLSTMLQRAPRLFLRGLTGRPELIGCAADLTVPPLSLLAIFYTGTLGLAMASAALTSYLGHALAPAALGAARLACLSGPGLCLAGRGGLPCFCPRRAAGADALCRAVLRAGETADLPGLPPRARNPLGAHGACCGRTGGFGVIGGLPPRRAEDSTGTAAPGVDVSIVVPVYNEEGAIPRLVEELRVVVDEQEAEGRRYELIFVSDGSLDRTVERLREATAGDPRMTVVQLMRNFGQTAATAAGFDLACGDVVVPIDGGPSERSGRHPASGCQARRRRGRAGSVGCGFGLAQGPAGPAVLAPVAVDPRQPAHQAADLDARDP